MRRPRHSIFIIPHFFRISVVGRNQNSAIQRQYCGHQARQLGVQDLHRGDGGGVEIRGGVEGAVFVKEQAAAILAAPPEQPNKSAQDDAASRMETICLKRIAIPSVCFL